ncbi:MAG: hypothetical protein KAS12_01835 [Candidatus Aenigmarchaeota archaeon]|nr:hypothetical protein [Candidatus Aenigmarchaeota archaeon]
MRLESMIEFLCKKTDKISKKMQEYIQMLIDDVIYIAPECATIKYSQENIKNVMIKFFEKNRNYKYKHHLLSLWNFGYI